MSSCSLWRHPLVVELPTAVAPRCGVARPGPSSCSPLRPIFGAPANRPAPTSPAIEQTIEPREVRPVMTDRPTWVHRFRPLSWSGIPRSLGRAEGLPTSPRFGPLVPRFAGAHATKAPLPRHGLTLRLGATATAPRWWSSSASAQALAVAVTSVAAAPAPDSLSAGWTTMSPSAAQRNHDGISQRLSARRSTARLFCPLARICSGLCTVQACST